MTERLYPCPFCGSRNVDVFSSFGDSSTDENIMNVECINCGAQGSSAKGEEKAVAVWNKRAGGNGAVNTELLAVVQNLAESNNYAHFKELQQDARKLIQQMRR